ncbi:hypothetical protein AN958_09687 [Leucoagaricus sp. SymC.cos]|nr:hypothetical protein AN958_09687 [Leucoagaricus sp. SymC.cos]
MNFEYRCRPPSCLESVMARSPGVHCNCPKVFYEPLDKSDPSEFGLGNNIDEDLVYQAMETGGWQAREEVA